jgi:hypothetical protein
LPRSLTPRRSRNASKLTTDELEKLLRGRLRLENLKTWLAQVAVVPLGALTPLDTHAARVLASLIFNFSALQALLVKVSQKLPQERVMAVFGTGVYRSVLTSLQ